MFELSRKGGYRKCNKKIPHVDFSYLSKQTVTVIPGKLLLKGKEKGKENKHEKINKLKKVLKGMNENCIFPEEKHEPCRTVSKDFLGEKKQHRSAELPSVSIARSPAN